MADIGPGPSELIKKRITVEIKRLEYMMEQQELEIAELDEKRVRLLNNIEASQKEIDKQKVNLESQNKVKLNGPRKETEVDG